MTELQEMKKTVMFWAISRPKQWVEQKQLLNQNQKNRLENSHRKSRCISEIEMNAENAKF